MEDDDWLAERDPPVQKLDNWSQLTRGSLLWTTIGDICSLTIRFCLDWPSLDMSTFSSLTSTDALGICNISRDKYNDQNQDIAQKDTTEKWNKKPTS